MPTTTPSTIIGVFDTREAAERAVAELRREGYAADEIGIVARDSRGQTVQTDGTGEKVAAGAVTGAAAGAGAMALGSLAVSFGIIPVVGPILAVGPLAAALISAAGGAAGGAAAGSLVGAMTAMGVSEDAAKYYESEVRGGKFVVTVHAADPDSARNIYARHGGYDKTTGWPKFS